MSDKLAKIWLALCSTSLMICVIGGIGSAVGTYTSYSKDPFVLLFWSGACFLGTSAVVVGSAGLIKIWAWALTTKEDRWR